MAKFEIHTVKGRSQLKPRREPYWSRVRAGCFVGFRVTSASAPGTWLARWRDGDTGKQESHPLGAFADKPEFARFDAAVAAAEEWFRHKGAGGTSEAVTVVQACRRYVEHLRDENREATAADAEGRFRRWIDSDPIGRIELMKLTHTKVRDWRKRLMGAETLPQSKALKAAKLADPKAVPTSARSAASVNREMTALRAALNHALSDALVTSDAAWARALAPIEGASRRRTEVYIDATQRRALAAAAQPDLAVFIRGLSLLPLRPGALAALTVADLDRKLGVLRVGRDKNGGERRLSLPPTTLQFFAEQAKGKLPAAPLLSRADGRRWDKDAWKKPFRAAAAAAKLPVTITAYALRHSTITDLIARHGLDLLTVAQLADTSPQMIGEHYGHLAADRARDALAGLAL